MVGRVPPRAAAVALAGALCFLAAFGVGRATGADDTAATPSLRPAPVAKAGMELPQLSEAAALPELAPPVQQARPAARAVVRKRPAARRRAPVRPTQAAQRPAAQKPAAPKRAAPTTPVVIVGRG